MKKIEKVIFQKINIHSYFEIGFVICFMLLAGVKIVDADPSFFYNVSTDMLNNVSTYIEWHTTEPANGCIQYGLDTNYGNLICENYPAWWHYLRLDNLQPNTAYHYRINATDYLGNNYLSVDSVFRTLNSTEVEDRIRAARQDSGLPKTYYVCEGGNNSKSGLNLSNCWANISYALPQLDIPVNTTNIFAYNDIWGNVLGNYNGTSAGIGDISADPLFANVFGYDFHLKSLVGRWNGTTWVADLVTSPAIGAGDPTSDNSKSPWGGIIEMGAYGNTGEASKTYSVTIPSVCQSPCTFGSGGYNWTGNTTLSNVTEDNGDHYVKIGRFADNFEDNNEGWAVTPSLDAMSLSSTQAVGTYSFKMSTGHQSEQYNYSANLSNPNAPNNLTIMVYDNGTGTDNIWYVSVSSASSGYMVGVDSVGTNVCPSGNTTNFCYRLPGSNMYVSSVLRSPSAGWVNISFEFNGTHINGYIGSSRVFSSAETNMRIIQVGSSWYSSGIAYYDEARVWEDTRGNITSVVKDAGAINGVNKIWNKIKIGGINTTGTWFHGYWNYSTDNVNYQLQDLGNITPATQYNVSSARYGQFVIELNTNDSSKTPALYNVTLYSAKSGIVLTITSPANTTYGSQNITISGSANGNANVTYSLNGNANISVCTVCTSFSTWNNSAVLGANNITVYAINSTNATDTDSQTIYFTVVNDSVPPKITIHSPLNGTYLSNSVWFNITLNETGSWVAYSLDGGQNISMTNSAGNWWAQNASMAQGAHSVRFYANDSVGNMNSSSLIYFTVNSSAGLCTAGVTIGAYTLGAGNNTFCYNMEMIRYGTITVADGANLTLNNVTLKLISVNNTANIYNLIVNGRLIANYSLMVSWNPNTNNYAPNADSTRSYVVVQGQNSSVLINNSYMLNLGYDGISGLNLDLGTGSVIITDTSFNNSHNGFQFKSSYGANRVIAKNNRDLSYIYNELNNSQIINNTDSGGMWMYRGYNISLVNNTGTGPASWNNMEFDGSSNSTAYGNVYGPSCCYHNGMQAGSIATTGPAAQYLLYKNNTVSGGVGGSGGTNAYYATWDGINEITRPHDIIFEDDVAYNFSSPSWDGMSFDGVRDSTIRRYTSWNISGSDMNIYRTKNVTVIDSNMAGIFLLNDGSLDTRIINTNYSTESISSTTITAYRLWYMDITVSDKNSNPLNNITVNINASNMSYPGYTIINIHGVLIQTPIYQSKVLYPQQISSAQTGSNGHTPLPSDEDNTIVVAAYRNERPVGSWEPIQTKDFNYTISAYDPNNIWTNITHTIYSNGTIQQHQPLAQATNIRPDSSWYRSNPNTYQNTTTLQINYTKTNITLAVTNTTNITVNEYSQSKINFTATNSTASQKMNITVRNSTFQITNGWQYSITKNGVLQLTQTAASGQVVFANINVGSEYIIQSTNGIVVSLNLPSNSCIQTTPRSHSTAPPPLAIN